MDKLTKERKLAEESIEIAICSDCMMFVANSETPVELNKTETDEWVAKFNAAVPWPNHVVPGNCSLGFSHSRCDICRGLAGNREQAFLFVR